MTRLKERAMINKDTYSYVEEVDVVATGTDHQFANQKVMSGLLVGTAGNVTVLMGNEENDDNAVTLHTLNAGIIHKIFFNKIKAAGTTALGIKGMD